MAQPTPYDRLTSFSNFQASNPADPLPGNTLDAELNAIKATLDEVLANIELIQRDDGALANESVGLDQLSEEIEVGWQAPTVWVTATLYVAGNTVFHGAGFYRLLVEHTAGVFATDLSAAKWELIVDLSGLQIVAASQISNTPAGSISAVTVQAAIDELASEKAATSHTHPSSAITDSTAAGRNMLSAANVAAQQALLLLGDLAFLDSVPITDISAQLSLSGIIEPAALNADTNDWAPTGVATCSTIRMSASLAINLTGLLAPAADGTFVVLENVGTSFAITLLPSSASSAAANRFLIPKPIVVAPNQSVVLTYDKDASVPRWRLFDRASILPRGHIFGLTLSNGTDATNDINIAAGECRGERNILDLVLTTAMGKQLDADWTAGGTTGTPLGGRYVSSANNPAIADTTYFPHLIGKADGTTDVIFYTGADPTSVLPAGYIDYRRLGGILRVSSTILAFSQNDDEFLLSTPVPEFSATNPGTSAVSRTLTTPVGIKTRALTSAAITAGSSGAGLIVELSSLDSSDATLGVTAAFSFVAAINGVTAVPVPPIRTNTSSQIRSRLSASGGSDILRMTTRGWFDTRGRDA